MSKKTFFRIYDLNGRQIDEVRGRPWLRNIKNLPEFLDGRDDIIKSMPLIIVEYDVEQKLDILSFIYNGAQGTVNFDEIPPDARPIWLLNKEGLFAIKKDSEILEDCTKEFLDLLREYIRAYSDLQDTSTLRRMYRTISIGKKAKGRSKPKKKK